MAVSSSEGASSVMADWVRKHVAPLVGVAALLGVVFGGFFWLEGHFAKAEEMSQLSGRLETKIAQLERRFEIKIRNDYLQATNTRIWQLQDRLKANPNDVTAREELRKLKEEKVRLERELEQLQKTG